MEVNLLNIVILALQDNPRTVSKLEKIYEREKNSFDTPAKQLRLDITNPVNRIKIVILQKSEADILAAIGDIYTSVKNNVKKGLRFKKTVSPFTKPTDIIKLFAIHKFFELLMNKWQDFDLYEKQLLALAYHDINKTRLRDFEPSFQMSMVKDVTKRSMISAFCGSEQLYAYVYGLLLHSDMSMEEVERVKLTAKDYKDISYEMAELIEANNVLMSEPSVEKLDFNIKNIYGVENSFQACVLMMIGTIVKVFAKICHQHKEELKTVKPKETVVVKEDLESKKKLTDKQNALNKLQLAYDKQQKKLETALEELQQMKEYVDIIEKIQQLEEQQNETNPGAKPVIPYGKGIILFGGHPNYQKKMVEKYNWIRTVDPEDVRVDWNMVKNASLILINWKHLPHRQFYSLISVIREYKKEYQYVW